MRGRGVRREIQAARVRSWAEPYKLVAIRYLFFIFID